MELSPDIEQKKAYQLTLRSKTNEDISSSSKLVRSLLFAELSMIAYLSPDQAKIAGKKLGFEETDFFNHDGSQAYAFANQKDIVIAFRGTEADEWNDLQADINAVQALAETVGRVHRGFKKEVDDLWPILEKKLESNIKSLWFTGHSLGGAMATICAGRCLFSKINSSPTQIQTFGSPRVGNKRYINHAKVDYIRWVNNNDIVTRSPPVWMGYRHTGQEMYLDSEGKIKTLNIIQRNQDRWKGFVAGLWNKEIDHLSDHSITRYVDYIYQEAINAGELDIHS
jgi:triacylglycerol lipase